MSRVALASIIGAISFCDFTLISIASPAKAADIEIDRRGVDIDTDDDRYDRYGDDVAPREYHDERYDRDRDDGVDIDVPGANIDID